MSITIRTAFGGVLVGLVIGGVSLAAREEAKGSQVSSSSPDARAAQTPASSRPSDIDPESRNRLPVAERESLDDVGKALFDKTTADAKSGRSLVGFQGPNGIGLHSPRVADSDQRKNDYLRFESPLGRRHYEIAVLVTARELDQQFEWSAHEPAALRAGVEPAVIDVVKFGRPLEGMQPKDAAIIQLGRELIGRHSVESSTFAEALRLFGAKDLVDVVSVMGHYSAIAALLNAFDQQLAPGQQPLLPER
jgi:4-carboxymuconolactone decarboxylase